MRYLRRDERGDAVTEVVLITPVLLVLIGVIINAALWYHGSQVANSAAQEGLRAAKSLHGTIQDGEKTTQNFVSQLGSSLVINPVVTISRDETTTSVDLKAHSIEIVPGLVFPIHTKVQAPTENFRAS